MGAIMNEAASGAFAEAGRMWRRQASELLDLLGVTYDKPEMKDEASLDSAIQALCAGYITDHPDDAEAIVRVIAHTTAIAIYQQDDPSAAGAAFLKLVTAAGEEYLADKAKRDAADG